MQSLLESDGYDVCCLNSSADAISEIENPETLSFSLIISSYRMPEKKGDEILQKARKCFPDTPRMLIADASDIYSMISSINEAGIQFCISVPFKDNEFIDQVDQGIKQFQAIRKLKNLKSVTESQNSQMFKLANTLKQKEADHLAQIKSRNQKIRILQSKTSLIKDKTICLDDVIAKKPLVSPNMFYSKFVQMKDQIQEMLELASSDYSINIQTIPYEDVWLNHSPKNEYREEIKQLLSIFFSKIDNNTLTAPEKSEASKPIRLEDYLELTFSEDKTSAFVRTRVRDPQGLDVDQIKEFLRQKGINSGIKNDHLIEFWISQTTPDAEKFIIAEGQKPKHSRDAEITYHFPVDFLMAGKLKSDGSIDFRERGETPFVGKDMLLAEKKPPVYGMTGLDVSGEIVHVSEPRDLSFGAGTGTRTSADGLRIYADIDGQPYLDAMGNVSVYPELRIKGDVCYETGNIQFDGNIYVEGTIRQGFSVKGASLAADQVEGAGKIELTGDLNVTSGIVDASLIQVMGSVHARYVNRSKIDAFGDLIVQKEIIDSTIRLSGACINETGIIMSSDISAKLGVSAGIIGTEVSSPSTISVGVDAYINSLVADIDARLNKNMNDSAKLKNDISTLETEYHKLHEVIAKHSLVQDRCQAELENFEKKIPDLRASGNTVALQRYTHAIKQLQNQTKQEEAEINRGFERQDAIDTEITRKKELVNHFETLTASLSDEKKRLVEFTEKDNPLPELRVAKKIMAGTRIEAIHSSLTLRESASRCRIMETNRIEAGDKKASEPELKILSY